MPRTVNFDTGSDLDDFVKGSDESDSEPELSASEAEYESSEDEEANNGARGVRGRMRVTRRARPMQSYVESSGEEDDSDSEAEEAAADDDDASEVDEGDEADDESEEEEEEQQGESTDSDGDDSEVDDDNPDVSTPPVLTITVHRRRTPVPPPIPVPPLAPALSTATPAWHKAVTNRYFSVDSGIRPFVHARVDGRHWTPKTGQRVRVGDVQGDHAFYAGKEGVVLGRSQTRPGKWRVTVHGSGLETALRGETGVAFHSSDLTPITSLKLHLNTVPTAELPVLRVLVASVTPAMVRTIQRARPFKSWPDLRTRVPALTDVTAALLRDLCAVNTSSTNTTWRAFAALGDDYATQLAKWSEMSVNQRLDARDDASEVIEAEKAARRREREQRVRAATAPPEGEPRAQRPRRAAAIAADAIGYREEDAPRLRRLEAQAWEAMQDE